MSKANILFAITNGMWFIQPEFVEANAIIIERIFKGEKVYPLDEQSNEEPSFKGTFSVAADGGIAFGSKYNPFKDAQPGSTAVIGMSGPVMKYDGFCGEPGTKTYASLLAAAGRHPNINSVVIAVDSPGGTVDGTQDLANIVKNFKQTYNKPIVTFVDGLMASAMYWIGSGAEEIIVNNETAVIGSIGTMLSFADVQPAFEKMGVKFHYITADASVDKNKDYQEARKGNYDLVKQKLNAINDVFLSSVKDNRAGKLDLKKENVLTGKTYLAQDALNAGLIDAINTFEYAVSRAQALAAGEKSTPESSTTQKTQTQDNMKKITLMATHAAILAMCGATIEAGKESVEVELTGEMLDKINAGLAASADNKTALDAANEKLKASETSVTTLNKTVSDQKASIETLEAKVRSLETPGASLAASNKEKEVTSEEKVNEELTAADIELAAKRKAIYGE